MKLTAERDAAGHQRPQHPPATGATSPARSRGGEPSRCITGPVQANCAESEPLTNQGSFGC